MTRKGIAIIASIVAIGAVLFAMRYGEKDFDELLEYEAQNRAFALLWTQSAAHKTENSDVRAFWQAYARLELLNQEMYAPHLKRHGIAFEPNRMTRVAVWASGFVLSAESESSFEYMRNSAQDYIPKLERLQSLATENPAFYAYVIAQEQAQVDALSLAAEGDLKAGAEVLIAFVEARRT